MWVRAALHSNALPRMASELVQDVNIDVTPIHAYMHALAQDEVFEEGRNTTPVAVASFERRLPLL
ncbi:hypothetical protein PPGU19_086300 (plasmid) [Paraburkholderia sp. PGU19]|nr:hypothetical protein PPGU19_086300 [Paraburkholderia sp. PGU19]